MATNHGFGCVPALTLVLLLLLAIAPPAVSSARAEAKKNPPTQSSGAGFFSPGSGFDIPGFGFPPAFGGTVGGGYGGGYSSPSGGSGVFRPSVVCKEKGPCYNKKLSCPAKCFKSYSSSGKNYGGGGGGGGCTMDFNLPMKKQPLEDNLYRRKVDAL